MFRHISHSLPGHDDRNSNQTYPPDAQRNFASQEQSPLLPAPNSRTARDGTPGTTREHSPHSELTAFEQKCLFSGIFCVGYAYGLESQVRTTYQPYATSSFSLHSYLSTINVLRSVVAVAVQPAAANIADIFGRYEVILGSTALYVLGLAMQSTSLNMFTFCAGELIYQAGYTAIVLLLEVLIADFSSLRARVVYSYIPALPFLINTWISGNVTSAVLAVTSWRWGIGMWCFIYPLCSLPLLVSLRMIDRKSSSADAGIAKNPDNGRASLRFRGSMRRRAHRMDALGLALLVMGFSLTLAPLSVIGSTSSYWKDPYVLASLLLGLLCVPTFILWERLGARVPLIPFHLLSDRGVWAALAIRSLLNFVWYLQGNYLYTILIVAFDFSIGTATRILNLFSFFGVLSGVSVGFVVYKTRRLKVIIIWGTFLFTAAFIILYMHPGASTSQARVGIVSGQVLLGISSGLFAYPTQALVQASASRKHVSILTGLYLSCYNVGSALGTCFAGAIWSHTLLPALDNALSFQPNRTLARDLYDSPFPVVARYPPGTHIRSAIIDSYASVQRLLCMAGAVLCIPMVVFALLLKNPRMSDQQVQPENQGSDDERRDEPASI